MATRKKTDDPETDIKVVIDPTPEREPLKTVSLGDFEPMTSAQPPSKGTQYSTGMDLTGEPFEEEKVGFYHNRGRAIPEYATALAAGFDLRASFEAGDEVAIHNTSNVPFTRTVKRSGALVLHAGERALIPTGLHADIPDCFYMSINARSGTSWKLGLILTNSRGIIDADYVDEIKISVTNNSGVNVTIEDGDRIAQGMLHFVDRMPFKVLNEKPAPKANRTGGFGSTGSK